MKLLMFSIHDKAIAAYSSPFYARAKGEAIRSFIDAVNDPKTPYHANPTDYSLFFMGEFDDGSGHILGSGPENILTANEALRTT